MERDAQSKARKFWDKTATRYDAAERGDEKTAYRVVESLKGYVKPTDTVLDIGCGTGLFANELAGQVLRIDAIDFSAKMIEIAREKTEKRQIHNISYLHATIFDDQLKPCTYDLILCCYIIHLLEDPSGAIRQMHSLLKPGGMLIAVTPCMGEKPFLRSLLAIAAGLGVAPPIKSFKLTDLTDLFQNEGFDLMACDLLAGTSNQYFTVVAK